jgi:hypothetical protein
MLILLLYRIHSEFRFIKKTGLDNGNGGQVRALVSLQNFIVRYSTAMNAADEI